MLLKSTKNSGGRFDLQIFAKEQKHLTKVLEVCLIVLDPAGTSRTDDPQFTISLKGMLGSITDQTDLFF